MSGETVKVDGSGATCLVLRQIYAGSHDCPGLRPPRNQRLAFLAAGNGRPLDPLEALIFCVVEPLAIDRLEGLQPSMSSHLNGRASSERDLPDLPFSCSV
jgi:hypothetical protein